MIEGRQVLLYGPAGDLKQRPFCNKIGLLGPSEQAPNWAGFGGEADVS